MRREKRARPVHLMQMFDRRPGDGKPVEGRRAASDLVEDDEGTRAGLIEDRRRLDHFHHEGGAPARQIVRRADTRKEPVHHADMRRGRRNETAHLRHNGDQSVLPEEGRLTGHVGTGEQPDMFRRSTVRRQCAVVGHEIAATRLAPERRFDHRMTPAFDMKGERVVDKRPRVALLGGKFGQGRGGIERGQRLGRRRDHFMLGQHLRGERIEQLHLQRERTAARIGDTACQIGEFGGREAHRIRHGLAMDEFVRGGQLVGMARRYLDVIAKHIVVPDLQGRHAGLFGILRLKPGDETARIVAQRAGLVEIGGITFGNEAAVTRHKRQLFGKRLAQLFA